MQMLFHPSVAHFPIIITFILPFLILAFAYMLKLNKMSPEAWFIILGLQLITTVSGYISLETGENEEEKVEKIVGENLIHAHEEAAEIFVGSTVIALVLGIAAFFIRKEFQFYLHLSVVVVSLISCYLAYRTGRLGGDLVYVHGAAAYHTDGTKEQGILPTPGMNTSESSYPVEGSESIKVDETDYDGSDSMPEGDEESKQED